MTKPFKTIDEQIDILLDRKLIIENIDEAKRVLENYNYYRLSGYSLTLRKDDNFYDEVHLSDILQIYNFDKELKNILLLALEDVEIELRTHIAYIIGKNSGPTGYLNQDIYASEEHYKRFSSEIIKSLKDNQNEAFVKHHNTMYGGVLPIWVLVETLSFGTLSRLFSSLATEHKKEICDTYYKGIPPKYVDQWMECLVVLRNMCAHHARLFNRGIPKAVSFTASEDNKYASYGYEKNVIGKRLFFFIVILSRLKTRDDQDKLIDEIKELNRKYPFVNLNHYGFGDNWEWLLMEANERYLMN